MSFHPKTDNIMKKLSEHDAAAPLLFLALSIVLPLAGLGIFALADQASEEVNMPETTLIVAADPHYLAPELTDHGVFFEQTITNSDGKTMEYVDELTAAFLAEVVARKPAALILPGDLAFNGERASHEALAGKLRTVSNAGIPVFVIPGNHDLENDNAARYEGDGFTRVESVTADEFAAIYDFCGFADAISRDEASLSYMAELSPSLRVLMLDVNTSDAPNTVKDETFAWAEAQLSAAKASGARVIAVSHQNVYRHNELIYDGYVIRNSDALLELYEEYGVIVNLSGHLHCQHIAQDQTGFYEIATSSLAVSPNQYGVITLEGGSLRYETIPTDVSGWAVSAGVTDKNLLDFAAYSLRFFQGSGRTQTPDRTDEARDFFARLNTAYFSGRMDLIDENDPGFSLWSDDSFFDLYVQSLRADAGIDSTRLTLRIGS